MPLDPPSAEVERKGVRWLEDMVGQMSFIYRDMPRPDVGLDGQIELKIGDAPTGQFIMVQVKSGTSYLRNEKPDRFDFYTDPNHLVYWKGCSNPVILVVYDPRGGCGYWKDLKTYLRTHPEIIENRPHKIVFDKPRDLLVPDTAAGFWGLFLPGFEEQERLFNDHTVSKHSKLTLYSVTSDRPLAVDLERVFVTLTATVLVRKSPDPANSAAPPDPSRTSRVPSDPPASEPAEDADDPDEPDPGELREIQLDVNAALRRHRVLVITGDPGAGKTTLLKYIALAFARELAKARLDLEERRVPILVALRDFNTFLANALRRGEIDAIGPAVLPRFLFKHFDDTAPHLKLTEGFFGSLLEFGRCAVLLDGLDEIPDPSHRARMAEVVAATVSSELYRANRFVLSSRPRGYEGEVRGRLAPLCLHGAVRPFTDDDVQNFAVSWYKAVTFDRLGDNAEARREAECSAASLTSAIQSEARVRALAQNPLMLSVLAMVHQRNIELPRLRSRLYEECTEFLLGYWDETKGGAAARELGRWGELDRDAKRALLEPIALWMHERGDTATEVDRTELEARIARQFEELGNDPVLSKRRARLFLGVIEERSGLLIERSPGVYAFAHLTFQEYLAARAVVDLGDDGVNLAIRHLHDPWWREVVLLTGSILSDVRSGPKTARRRTSSFLGRIETAESWMEQVLARDLTLAIRSMGDMEVLGVDEEYRQRLADRGVALWMASSQPRQKAQVASAFAYASATPHAQRFLLSLLNTPSLWDVSETSESLTRVVQEFGAAAGPAASHLLTLAAPESVADRGRALAALARVPASAFSGQEAQRLLALRADASEEIRNQADHIWRMHECASRLSDEQLMEWLDRGNPRQTRLALEAWADRPRPMSDALHQCLLRLARTGPAEARAKLASVLAHPSHAFEGSKVHALLHTLSRDPAPSIRRTVVSAWKQNPIDSEAESRLLELATDPEFSVRFEVLRTWADVTPPSEAILPLLLGLSRETKGNPREFLRAVWTNLLTSPVAEVAWQQWHVLASDPEPMARTIAIESVRHLDGLPPDGAFAQVLVDLTRDGHDSVRWGAIGACFALGCASETGELLKRIRELGRHRDPAQRVKVAEGLASLRPPTIPTEAALVLLEFLDDPDEQVRNAAAETWAAFAEPVDEVILATQLAKQGRVLSQGTLEYIDTAQRRRWREARSRALADSWETEAEAGVRRKRLERDRRALTYEHQEWLALVRQLRQAGGAKAAHLSPRLFVNLTKALSRDEGTNQPAPDETDPIAWRDEVVLRGVDAVWQPLETRSPSGEVWRGLLQLSQSRRALVRRTVPLVFAKMGTASLPAEMRDGLLMMSYDSDPEVRSAVVDAWSSLSEELLDSRTLYRLLMLTGDSDKRLRARSANRLRLALGSPRVRAVASILHSRLGARYLGAGETIARGLLHSGARWFSPELKEVWIALGSHPDPSTRLCVAQGGRYLTCPEDLPLFPALVALGHDPDPQVREAAIDSLSVFRRSPEALVAILNAVMDSPYVAREPHPSLSSCLTEFHAEAVTETALPLLLRASTHAACSWREVAAHLLGRFAGPDTAKTISQQLLALSRDENPGVREAVAAAWAQGKAAQEDLEVEARLLQLADDRDVFVRRQAIRALGWMDPERLGANPHAQRILATPPSDAHSRLELPLARLRLGGLTKTADLLRTLAVAVEGMTPPKRHALLHLIAQVHDPTPHTLAHLVRRIHRLRLDPGHRLLRCLLEECSPLCALEVFDMAADAGVKAGMDLPLALETQAGTGVKPAVFERLLQLVEDPRWVVRASAAESWVRLAKISETFPETYPLTSLLRHPRSDVRGTAALAIGMVGKALARPGVILRLADLTEDTDQETRRAAIRALGLLGSTAATPYVIDRLVTTARTDRDWTSAVALRSLGQLGVNLSRVPDLELLVRTGTAVVRWTMVDILVADGPEKLAPALFDVLLYLVRDDLLHVNMPARDLLGRMPIPARPEDLRLLGERLEWHLVDSAANSAEATEFLYSQLEQLAGYRSKLKPE